MANTTLEIIITKRKNKNKILIDKNNVSESCDKLLKAYKNNYKIKHPLQWHHLNKDIFILINIIGIHIEIRLTDGFDLFSNKTNKYSISKIKNLAFLLNIMFTNNLMLKKYMKDELQWKPLFDLFKIILSHKHVMNIKFLSLITLITKTQKYWNSDHLRYFHKIELYKALCIGIKTQYYQNNKYKTHPQYQMENIIYSITLNYYKVCYRSKETEIWYKRFKNIMDTTLISQQQQLRIQKYRQMSIQSGYSYISFVNKYRRIICGHQDVAPILYYHRHKVCAHFNCSKIKTKKNKIKMKICKGCLLVYYCSKKCQKRDWKLRHREQCERLCLM